MDILCIWLALSERYRNGPSKDKSALSNREKRENNDPMYPKGVDGLEEEEEVVMFSTDEGKEETETMTQADAARLR